MHRTSATARSVAHVTTIAESLKTLLLNQLVFLQERGFDVCGVSAPGPGVAALEGRNVQHVAVPFVRASNLTPVRDLGATARMVQVFRQHRFTIVHTHTAKPDLFAAIAARLAGVPIVVSTLHGFYFDDRTPQRQRALFVRLARLGMRFCDLVLSQNEEDIATAERERICPPDKIELLGNGIDLTRFDRDRLNKTELRAELGIPRTAPVVGYVGRMTKEKGVLDLLHAMVAIRRDWPEARLLLVGMIDREKADAIGPATAEQLGLGDVCIFTGHRDDVPELYAAMDICVLASHREGFPRSVMEASAMGVPVVATNIRGCRNAVEQGQNGLLVEVQNPEALRGALETLLGDDARRAALGAGGIEVARRRFDETKVFAKVASSYDRLLARKGA